MINRKIVTGILIAGIFISVFWGTACTKPEIENIAVGTPAISAEPTPSTTPKIEISEDDTQDTLIYLGFDALLDYLTSSQYNYTMISIQEFFNSLYQSNIRKYAFTQYKSINTNLLNEKCMFANDEETKVPFNMFAEIYAGNEAEYKFILDEETVEVADYNYRMNVDLYVSGEKAKSFLFIINKKTLQLKIKESETQQP
ncbi:MAG: hypothetical protein AB1Z23_10065 [Eubacteriales bacterium]